jgi:hypothetical protein
MAILQVTAPTAALTRVHTSTPAQVTSTPVVKWWPVSADGATRGNPVTSVAAVPAGYFVERITRT